MYRNASTGLQSPASKRKREETMTTTTQTRFPGAALAFDLPTFFPRSIMGQITEVRVDAPTIMYEQAQARARRPKLTKDGRLVIIAADHTAHHDARVGANPLAMANRYELLGRILRVLVSPEVDGLLATPDIIEDLLIVDALLARKGVAALLDHKVLVGTLNPGGLGGSTWELNSPATSYTPRHIVQLRLDGAKMLLRASLEHAETLPTLVAAAEVINALTDSGVPTFIEPIPVQRKDGAFSLRKHADALAPLVCVCSALGGSSRHSWLKVPYCEDFELVAGASTLPILMLGGASLENPAPMLAEFSTGMAAGPNVRGAMVGRNVLYPGNVDPQLVGRAISRIVHRGESGEQVLDFMRTGRAEHTETFSCLQ